MAEDRIDIRVVVDGEQELRNLSSSLKNLSFSLSGAGNATKSLDAAQRGLNKAIGGVGRGAGDHAKSIKSLIGNQAALGQEIRKTSADLKMLQQRLSKGKISTNQFGVLNKSLVQTQKNLKKIRPRALASDFRSLGIEMKRLGKDAQFVGRSLIIGLTTPLLLFANRGLQAFLALDRETIRLNKILGETFKNVDQVTASTLEMSNQFGIARELLTGVTADFAELGINSADALTGLTKVASQMSILGSMDISESQELTQTLFLGTMRTMDNMGMVFESAAEKQGRALQYVQSQMYILNSIENMTALSFRDMAAALPEVTAAAIPFGLSMTQATAFLAPMKAAGIDVPTAANGIKVSFQRMASPTKQFLELAEDLGKRLERTVPGAADSFAAVNGVGLPAIQGLIDATIALKKETDDETVIDFYAKLFQKRQATRMLVPIESMIAFQKEMTATTDSGAPTFLNKMIGDLNSIIRISNQANKANLSVITNVESLGRLSQIASSKVGDEIDGVGTVTQQQIDAARQVRKEFQKYIKEAREAPDGVEVIEQITSEAGKALLTELAGAASAQELAQRELDIALNSTSVSVDRMKNAFKNTAADIVRTFAPVIEDISMKVQDFAKYIQNLPDSTKKMIVGIGAAVAALGPLVFLMGQLRLAGGVALTSLMKFVPGLTNLGVESLAGAEKMLYLRNGITRAGDSIINTNGKFATMIATIASGNGPIAKFADRFGRSTGILSKHVTAADDVIIKMKEMRAVGERAVDTTFGGTEMAAAKKAPKKAVRKGFAQQFRATGATAAGTAAATAGTTAGTAVAGAGKAGVSPLGAPLKQMMPQPTPTPVVKNPLAAQVATTKKIAKRLAITEAEAAEYRLDQATGQIRKRGKFVSKFEENIVKQEMQKIPQRANAIGQAQASALDKANQDRVNRVNAARNKYNQDLVRQHQQTLDRTKRQQKALDDNAKRAARKTFADEDRRRRVRRKNQIDVLKQRADFNKKVGILESRGVTATSSIKKQFGTGVRSLEKSFQFRGRDITEAQANRIGMGGVRGAATRARLTAGAGIGRARTAVADMGKAVGGKALGPVKGFKKAMDAAGQSIRNANAQAALFGAKSPGVFKRAGLAVKGFTKSILTSIRATKLLKLAMMGTGIGLIFMGIALAVAFVKDNFDALRKKAEPLMRYLELSWTVIKNAIKAIISPVLDLMGTLLGLGRDGPAGSAVDGFGKMFNNIGKFVLKASVMFQDFVNKYVVPLVKIAVEYLFAVVRFIAKIVKAVIHMKNNWKEGLGMIWDAIKQFGGAMLGLFGPLLAMVTDLFFEVVKFIVNGFEWAFRGVVELLSQLVQGFISGGRLLTQLFTKLAEFIPDAIGFAIRKAGGFFASLIEKIGEGVDWASGKLAWLTGGLIPSTDLASKGQEIRNFFDGVGDSVSGFGDGLVDTVNGFFDGLIVDVEGLTDDITDWIHGWSDGIDGLKNKVGDFFRGFAKESNVIDGAGSAFTDLFGKEAEEEMEEIADDILDPLVDSAENAGEEAGNEFADKFAEALKDLKQRFVDLIGGFFTDEISKVTDELISTLEKQRDAALKVYDDQLETIEKLGQAEESLMREREFIADRKKMLDERELNRQNYVRNRALAIYEGRIDDARMLDLQEQKDKMDSAQSLQDLEGKRNEELRKENLEFLKEQIKETQKQADEFFKSQVEAFKEAAKEITRFAPQTVEDYEEQLRSLSEKAYDFARVNATEFSKTFDKMRQKIVTDMPNKVNGIFESNLDELVNEARNKYGLSGQSDSIIGSTVSMLVAVGDAIGSDVGVSTNWKTLIQDMSDELNSNAVGSIRETIINRGPQRVLQLAIEFANETILRAWRGTIDHIISEVDYLAGFMDPVIADILKAQLAFEALEKAAKDAASASANAGGTSSRVPSSGGGGGGGGSAGSSTTPSVPAVSKAITDAMYAVEVANKNTASVAGYITKPKVEALERAAVAQAQRDAATAAAAATVAANQSTYNANIKNSMSSLTWGTATYSNFVKALGGTGMTMRAYGGYVPGFKSSGVPTMLHGGEYVLNAKAVQNLGISALNAINNTRFSNPGRATGQGAVTTINKTENINIYVDNFIGEERWFESMMDTYNIKVKPVKEKSRGEEVRMFNSYNYRTGR